MEMRRTFIVSLLLHLAFSAILLLSVRFQGEGGKMPGEKIFFIDLRSNAEKPTAVITKDVSLKKIAVKNTQKEPAVIVEKREAGFTESHSIYSEEASGIAKSSDMTYSNDTAEYANPVQGGEEILGSPDTIDDHRAGLSESDALKLISTAIEKAKTYPGMAIRRGIEGTVYVSFRIGHEGNPDGVEVLKSSGYKILDEATLNVVKQAAPYPYIESRIEIPVTYRLKD